MITLPIKEFVNELEHAFYAVLSLGFFLGLMIGIFIAINIYIKYAPD